MPISVNNFRRPENIEGTRKISLPLKNNFQRSPTEEGHLYKSIFRDGLLISADYQNRRPNNKP